VGDDVNLLFLNFYVLSALFFPTSSFFKVAYHEYPCAFSVKSVMLYSHAGTYPWVACIPPFLGLIKRSYHGWLSMIMSSEGPLFSLASAPTPKSTTGHSPLAPLDMPVATPFLEMLKPREGKVRFADGWATR